MTSLIGSTFGKTSASRSTNRSRTVTPKFNPFSFTTGSGANLNVDEAGGSVATSTLAPFIRNNVVSLLSGVGREVQSDIGRLRELENPFVQARVRPTVERFERLRADTERGSARRGVQGTLANNELLRIDDTASRVIADEGAKAEAEVLGAVLQRQGVFANILAQIQDVGEADIRQALAELGIGVQAQDVLFRNATKDVEEIGTSSGSEEDTSRGIEGLGNFIGAAGRIGQFASSGSPTALFT